MTTVFRWRPQEEQWLRQRMTRAGFQDRKHWMNWLVDGFLQTFPPTPIEKGGVRETDEEFFQRKIKIPTRIDKWVRNHYPKLWDNSSGSQPPQSISALHMDSAVGNNEHCGISSSENATFNFGGRSAVPNSPSSMSELHYGRSIEGLATPGVPSTAGFAQQTNFSEGYPGHAAPQSSMYNYHAHHITASASTNVHPRELANGLMNAPQGSQYTRFLKNTSAPNAYVAPTLQAVPSTEASGQARVPVSVLPSDNFTHGQRHAANVTSDTRHGSQYTPSQHNTQVNQTNTSTVPSAYGVVTGAYISHTEALSPTNASPSMPATSQNQGRNSLLNNIVDDRLVEALGAEVDSTGSVWINLLEHRQDYSYTSRARVVRGELHDVMFQHITRRRL